MKRFVTCLLCAVNILCVLMFSACSTERESFAGNNIGIGSHTPNKPVDTDTSYDETSSQQPDIVLKPDDFFEVPDDPFEEELQDPDIKRLAQYTLYADVGDGYDTVMQPIKNTAEYIVADLTENGIVSIPGDAVITGIRYYGEGLNIWFRQIPKIYGTQTDNEFLYTKTFVRFPDFVGTRNDWLEYSYFLQAERGCAGMEDYVETILPHARRIADMIKAQYEEYKANGGLSDVVYAHNGNDIVLKADSFLSETYRKIVGKFNALLEKNNLPVITDRDVCISFGGNIYQEVVFDTITINIYLQNYTYRFSAEFNEDGRYTEEWLNYFINSTKTGYWSPSDALYVPQNEDYAEFFEKMQIEEIDFKLTESMDFTFFHTGIYEGTFLYF